MNDPESKIANARELLEVFLEQGEVLSDQRHVIHFAYGGDCEGMAHALRELGYAVELIDGDRCVDGGRHGLIAERVDVTDAVWVDATIKQWCEIADRYGVEYDGWEASVERLPPKVANDRKPSLLSKLFGKAK